MLIEFSSKHMSVNYNSVCILHSSGICAFIINMSGRAEGPKGEIHLILITPILRTADSVKDHLFYAIFSLR